MYKSIVSYLMAGSYQWQAVTMAGCITYPYSDIFGNISLRLPKSKIVELGERHQRRDNNDNDNNDDDDDDDDDDGTFTEKLMNTKNPQNQHHQEHQQ